MLSRFESDFVSQHMERESCIGDLWLEVFKRLVHVNDSLILCDPFCVNIINNLFLLDRDIVTKITPSRKMGLCIFFMLYRV